MKSKIGHVGINIPESSFPFLKELLDHLGLSMDLDDGTHCHFGDGGMYLCVTATKPGYVEPPYHRKRTGLSHLAFQVPSREDVDRFVVDFLDPRRIAPLYGGAQTPEGYPGSYYGVWFEDTARLKFEVVCEGNA